jgi:hypothetical protein
MSTDLRPPNPALVEINRRNATFWEGQRDLRDRRMADPAILATAIADISSELARGVHILAQKLFETALADAEATKRRFSSQRGRDAGRTRKADPLQVLIEAAVRRKPKLTEMELRQHLENHAGIEPIQEVTRESIFVTKPNDATKKVPLSGLKHRLSRAKGKLKKL